MKRWKYVVLICLCLFGIPLVINGLFKIDSGVIILQSEWTAGETLAFYGAILSGVATVLGVRLTINHANDKAKEDEAIKYKPIIEIVSPDSDGKGKFVDLFIKCPNSYNKDKGILYDCFIKNIGRGETSNAAITKCEICNVVGTDLSKYTVECNLPNDLGEIVKDEIIQLKIMLPAFLYLSRDVKKISMSTKIHLEYSDMFNWKKYRYILTTDYEVSVLRYVDERDISWARVQYKTINIMSDRISI